MDLMNDLWEGNVRNAEEGSRHAAKAILRDFIATVANCNQGSWSGPVPWQYAQFLAGAFQMMVTGVDANRALCLAKGDRSLDPDLKRLRNFRYCLRVLRLKSTGQFGTWEEAKKVAARKLRVSKSTIDKAWKTEQRLAAEIEFRRKRGKKVV